MENALKLGADADLSDDCLIGRGVAAGMIDIPPRGRRAECLRRLTEDGAFELKVGTAEFGNGTTTVHGQIAASVLNTTLDRVPIKQSDTELIAHDTGAYGRHWHGRRGVGDSRRRGDLGHAILDFAASCTSAPRRLTS